MFRGTYLDSKEKGDVFNEKYFIPEKKSNELFLFSLFEKVFDQ